MAIVKEIPVKFTSHGSKLFGKLHLPAGRSKSIIIFANGFPDNVLDHHIVIASARYFSEKGFAFLRFNPRGRWPSEGKFTKMDVSDTAEDLQNAIQFARRRGFKKIGVIGHSLGGLAAILVSKKYVTVLALWEPSSLKLLLKIAANKKMKRQMKDLGYAVNEDYGMVMGSRMYREFERLGDLSDKVSEIEQPLLVVAGTSHKPMTEASREYFNAAKEPKEFQIIRGANHTFDDSKHEQELFRLTLEWFRKWIVNDFQRKNRMGSVGAEVLARK